MSVAGSIRAAMTRRNIFVVALLTLAAWCLARLSWQGQVVGIVADDATYMLLVDRYSPYSQALRESAAFISQRSVFPPLYPALLALLGADSSNILYAHMLSTTIELVTVALVIRYLAMTRLPFALVVAVATLFFLMPMTLLVHVELLSEPLYLAITLVALCRYESLGDTPDLRKVRVIAVWVALAVLTRAAGIALVAAFLIWQLTGARHNRSVPAMLIAVVPYLLWLAVKPTTTDDVNYTAPIAQAYSLADPAALISRLGVDADNLWRGWHAYFDVELQPYSLAAAVLLPVCAAPTLLARLRERRLDALYVLLYSAMVLLWPFPDHTPRFLYPVVPIVFYYAVVSLIQYCRAAWRNYAFAALFTLISFAAAPSTAQILVKAFSAGAESLGGYGKTRMLYGEPQPMRVIEHNSRMIDQLAQAMRDSRQYVPAGACVYVMHFEWYMFNAKRAARPITDEDLRRLNAPGKPACDYLFVNWSTTHRAVGPGYPLRQLKRPFRLIRQFRVPGVASADGTDPVIAELIQFQAREQ